MELNLDKDLIRSCNSNSHFNPGNIIADEAVNIYKTFENEFSDYEELTEEQITLLEKRKLEFKGLVENAYNNILRNRSEFVPVIVAGPANYNHKKMDKIAERNMARNIEWSDKIKKFIENTKQMLSGLTPIDIILENYRNGKWKYGEVILSNDPYALEKLNAKLEYLEGNQIKMKSENKKARAVEKDAPYPAYMLSNNLATVKSVKKRIEELTAPREESFQGYEFNGGEVTPNFEIDRLQIFFDSKPNEEVRRSLKGNGFRWAPSEGAWQRKLNENALYTAKKLFKEMNEINNDEDFDYYMEGSWS